MQWNKDCVGKKIIIKGVNSNENDRLLIYRVSKIGIGIHKIAHVINYDNAIYTFVINGKQYLIRENDAKWIEVEILENE